MLLLAVLVLAGCGREKKIESELLGIEEKDGYTLVTVRDPWKAGQTLHRYALVPRDKPLPDGLPDATVIKVPLRSAVVYSDGSHMASVLAGLRPRVAASRRVRRHRRISWVLMVRRPSMQYSSRRPA